MADEEDFKKAGFVESQKSEGPIKPLHVLITGGTGFIGHNVVLDLLDWTDWRFTIVDAHTYAGAPEKLTEDPRYDPWRIRVLTHDLSDPFEESKTLTKDDYNDLMATKIDAILNIASNSHVDGSIEDPAPFIINNTKLVVNMLEFARKVKPKLFVQFSTDEVYGPAPEGVDFKEWSTILPSNPYSASKAAQEAIAISYWRTYGVPVVLTNTMNVLGKRQHPEKFVPKTIEYLLAGKPMTVHAEWIKTHNPQYCPSCIQSQYGRFDRHHDEGGRWEAGSRYYTFVTNISSALRFLIERNGLLGPVLYPDSDRPERFNLVGDREVKNDEMVDLIADILGVDSQVQYKEFVDFHKTRPGHDRRYALDGSALKEAGWTPVVSFEEGLKITVEDALEGQETTWTGTGRS